jgi:hypothetical protein
MVCIMPLFDFALRQKALGLTPRSCIIAGAAFLLARAARCTSQSVNPRPVAHLRCKSRPSVDQEAVQLIAPLIAVALPRSVCFNIHAKRSPHFHPFVGIASMPILNGSGASCAKHDSNFRRLHSKSHVPQKEADGRGPAYRADSTAHDSWSQSPQIRGRILVSPCGGVVKAWGNNIRNVLQTLC